MSKKNRQRRAEPRTPQRPTTAPSAVQTAEPPAREADHGAHAPPHSKAAASPMRAHVLWAILKRNFLGYFSNPAGYVFIFLFVLVASWAEFWQPVFFTNNLANLDPLNHWMPYILLFFIPAITMSAWAEERRQGTEELLLTLPARDFEVVLGKFFAAVGIYTVALAFLALGHGIILLGLGKPDLGVLAATFVGYWLMGLMMIAIGLVASMLSSNVTVAFILGGLFCAIPVFAGLIGTVASDRPRRLVESLSIPAQFRDFGTGAIPLSGVLYFVSFAVCMLYVNMVLLGRRHWAGGEASKHHWAHVLARVVSVGVALVGLDILAGYFLNTRVDATQERLHSLSETSRRVVRDIPVGQQVIIQAYYSPDVPREYVSIKTDLLNSLKEYAAIGGDKIRLNLIETERFSPEARAAEKRFGITAKRVPTIDQARQSVAEIYLGAAFTRGGEEVVVPFFDRGMPVEYELTRSIRTVAGEKRKKVGILATDAKLLGGLDFRAMSQEEEWNIVTELKKQYEVAQVTADAELPTDLDCLLVAQPSSLTQKQIDNLTAYVRKGGPTLMFLDPMPASMPSIAPREERQAPGGPFGGGPPPERKGDLRPLLDLIGFEWPDDQIVWNLYSPYPQLQTDPEIIFIGLGQGNRDVFGSDAISAGLQELIFLFPGYLQKKPDAKTTFTPLARTNDSGGTLPYDEVVQRGFLGAMGLNRARPHFPSGMAYTLAAKISGKLPPAPEPPSLLDEKDKPKPKADSKPGECNVIAIADLDMISDMFFSLRRKENENLDFLGFDNITFVLNCVDSLAGDPSFMALRKKGPRHRTLLYVEEESRQFVKESQDNEKKADERAKSQLAEAQKRLDDSVKKIQDSKELDQRTKETMVEYQRQVEQRKFDVKKSEIEDQKRLEVEDSKAVREQRIQGIQNKIRALAIALPPLPALLLGIVVFAVRVGRENQGASPTRLA